MERATHVPSAPDPLSRRRFVGAVGATAAGLVVAPALLRNEGAHAAPAGVGGPLPTGLFTLGVASGDPAPDGVVLWTRLAPAPLGGGGLPRRPYPVEWEVAEDDAFSRVVRRGRAVALPDYAHSVHVEVDGLSPGADYVYRFRAGREVSPVGRTRTAPAAGAATSGLHFAFASCHNWQDGYFTAYEALAAEDLAFVAFLGDYIYESVPRTTTVRTHEGSGEPVTLEQYRNRHAQYKTDPDLQAAHAAFPWVVTWDDHELDNNWADEIPQDPAAQSPDAFRRRRVAAFQAYYEHMPLRRSSRPRGLDLPLYRRLAFGDLVDLHVLDTRQYRSDQPPTLAAASDPALTMTGAEQERWLTDGLTDGDARWNLLANQVMWAQNDRRAGPEQVFDLDNWDGYRAQRRRLLELFGSGAIANPVVLTGDRHATWVCDLEPDFDDRASPVVGAEITGSSVTSGGDPDTAAFHATYDPIKAESPHWRYIDNQRGYVVCDVTPERMLSSLRVVDTVWQPEGASVRTAAEFVVEAGVPGVTVVSEEPAAVEQRVQARRAAGPVYDVDDTADPYDLDR